MEPEGGAILTVIHPALWLGGFYLSSGEGGAPFQSSCQIILAPLTPSNNPDFPVQITSWFETVA